LKKSEDAHRGEAEWAYPLSKWVDAAVVARAPQVHRLLEQQEPLEWPEQKLQEPQKLEWPEQELRERTAQEPELRGAAQHYQTKK